MAKTTRKTEPTTAVKKPAARRPKAAAPVTGAETVTTRRQTKTAPGAAPVSLGLLRDDPLSVRYPAWLAGWVLAVSVEPEGGSPTGAPTGPVILTAEMAVDA